MYQYKIDAQVEELLYHHLDEEKPIWVPPRHSFRVVWQTIEQLAQNRKSAGICEVRRRKGLVRHLSLRLLPNLDSSSDFEMRSWENR